MTFDNKDWIAEIQKGIKTVQELRTFLPLQPNEIEQLEQIIQEHPMLVSKYYVSLIKRDDPHDPLRKMMVPSIEEFDLSGDYDTSGELLNTKVRGLQHKYSQTALILTTNICSGYCRYCFRKRLIGLPNREILANFDDIIDYIAAHPEIDNVLLSGGDPFVLKTTSLAEILEKLDRLPQLKFIRIGTKVPVVYPRRINEDKSLLKLLSMYSKPDRRIFIVTQFNHPRELTKTSIRGIGSLIQAGCTISNQTALLKGVNDTPEVLAELMTGLTGVGILPYYVFHCRPVKRVKHHFQFPLSRGIDIVESAKILMNGQAKRFKYAMSHKTGKIEIIGKQDGLMYFKYHQAKDTSICGKMFTIPADAETGWLEEINLPLPN